MSTGDTITTKPVEGYVCPSCGGAQGIVQETRTAPLGPGELFSAAIFGVLGAIVALVGKCGPR